MIDQRTRRGWFRRILVSAMPLVLCGFGSGGVNGAVEKGWIYGEGDRLAGEGLLIWKHGESIRGRLAHADGTHLTWEAPQYFADAITIDLTDLRRINFSQRGTQPREECSIRMRDGTRLYGQLVAIDGDTVTIRSERHGDVVIERGAVLSVHRLKGGRLKYAGPTSVAGWDILDEDAKKRQFWKESPGGRLTQVGWNKQAFLKLETEDLIEVDVVLRSSNSLRFRLEFLTPEGRRGLTVETWDDELVLQGRTFASLRTLAHEDREISLRLYWDRKSGRTAVFCGTGEKLAESRMSALPPENENASDKAPKGEGLLIHNKGPNLTLETLRIRSWDGVIPDGTESVRPRIVMKDGGVIAGEVLEGDRERLIVVDDGHGGKRRELPWLEVEAVEFSMDEDWKVEGQTVELWFTDGAWLAGNLVAGDSQGVSVQTDFSAKPVRSSVDDLARIELKMQKGEEAPEPIPFAERDRLIAAGKTLQGRLVTGGAGLEWRPMGATRAVRLRDLDSVEFTRAIAPGGPGIGADSLLYLKSGDIVPGELRSVSESVVEFESALVERREYPAEEVSAVQFVAAEVEMEGFGDDAWERMRGTTDAIELEGDKLVLKPGGSFGHPAMLQGDQIKFNFGGDRQSYAAMRVRLFCNGTDVESPSTNLVFGRYGQDVVFGVERILNQLDSQHRMASPQGKATPVRIGIKEDLLDISINGVSVRKVPVTPEMRSGIGVVFEPCGLWGNDERECEVSAFSVRRAPGITSVPGIDGEAKSQALTVPRFRQDDPPRHALVAANGDLLRGVIGAVSKTHYGLRSGLETLQIPRSRVAAVVWLGRAEEDDRENQSTSDPGEGDRGEGAEGIHWLQLANGARLGIEVSRFEADMIYGRHGFLGECEVPVQSVYQVNSSEPDRTGSMRVFEAWELVYAPDPVLPESGGQSSEMLGQEISEFSIPYLGKGKLESKKLSGKVVVFDFWATWCGPCVKALPELIDAMAEFDGTDFLFVGINQGESEERVKRFLETRGWDMRVAMDLQQRVGQSFGVEGIPHTVIVGPDGKVAWVKTGYDPSGAGQAATVVRRLLGGGGMEVDTGIQ
ncbi:MAG: TlpA disulfide reductase family protein [Verrucomicrobiota bacterium]